MRPYSCLGRMIPAATFQPGVKCILEKIFCAEKAVSTVSLDACRSVDRFNNLLKVLSYPPATTVLRVDTLHHSREDIRNELNRVLLKQYRTRGRPPPTVHLHPILDDVVVVVSCHGYKAARPTPGDKEVVVDLPCGLAVLRGADVYAPAVMAAPVDMTGDTHVSVFADLDGRCHRGLLHPFTGNKVFLGNGLAVQGRKELFVGNKVPNGVAVRMTQPLFDSPSMNGILSDRLFLQNLPSVVVGHVMAPTPGSRLLDMCTAPGGKATHMAALMQDRGSVIALDKSQAKIDKVSANAARLGLNCIQTYVYDSTKSCDMRIPALQDTGPPPYSPESFDYILVDAPCSGLGQRPQLSNKLQLSELKSYPAYQRQFVSTAVKLLRPGGTLVYSTCTITLEENEEIVEWALRTYTQLKLAQQVPHLGGVGLEGTSLSPANLSLLQRFHPASSWATGSPVANDQDTIGFFIAKFVKDP